MGNTNQQYDQVISGCRDIFIKKATDYGTAWRVLRTISIVDQIFIKAQRIRTIQEKGAQKVSDGIAAEFKGIINYCHDYGEAWRSMSQESFTDLILMKLQRIRQILSNDGKTLISEGIDANYLDILNYAVFALILI